MRLFFNVFTLMCIFASLAQVHADSWGLVKQTEFFSPQQKYMLKIVPHKDWPDKPGHCQATLYKIGGGKQKKIWSRHLINDYAPVQVFVADSGKYVITMDEWHHVGTLPIVIYGAYGRLISVHGLDSLGLKYEYEHIIRTVSSYWWNEDSISFFDPNQEFFIVRLHWGKMIFLDLDSGDLMDSKWHETARGKLMPEKKWQSLHRFASKQVKELAIQLLDSEDSNERKTGALVCGQNKIEKAIPRLIKLLSDTEYSITNLPKEWTRSYYVRKAAKAALENMGQKLDSDVIFEEPDKKLFGE